MVSETCGAEAGLFLLGIVHCKCIGILRVPRQFWSEERLKEDFELESSTGRASRERERVREMSNGAEGAAELRKDGQEIQPLLTPYQLGPFHLSHR